MDIEDLSIKQARELMSLFAPTKADPPTHPFVGRYVIARCRDAGVHAGVLESASGQTAILRESRRLWIWQVPVGAPSFLSGVAVRGIAGGKVGTSVDISLQEVCELIPCSPQAEKSIREMAECLRTK